MVAWDTGSARQLVLDGRANISSVVLFAPFIMDDLIWVARTSIMLWITEDVYVAFQEAAAGCSQKSYGPCMNSNQKLAQKLAPIFFVIFTIDKVLSASMVLSRFLHNAIFCLPQNIVILIIESSPFILMETMSAMIRFWISGCWCAILL